MEIWVSNGITQTGVLICFTVIVVISLCFVSQAGALCKALRFRGFDDAQEHDTSRIVALVSHLWRKSKLTILSIAGMLVTGICGTNPTSGPNSLIIGEHKKSHTILCLD